MLRRQLDLLLVAIQFLTRIPTPQIAGFDPDWISRSARYFPLVGQAVGAISALVFFAASQVWPPAIAALLAIATGVLVTGGFHEDGLADTADGLGGGQTSERRLEIMKDSRLGSYGALALGLTLALKTAALASLPPLVGALVLLTAHGLGRGAAVVAMAVLPYARGLDLSKWKPSPTGLSAGEVAIALLLAAWPLALLSLGVGGAGLALGALLALAPAFAARRLIGGQTGDVLGAVEQMFELGFLLGAAALSR